MRIEKAASDSEITPAPDYRSHVYLTNYYNSPDKDRELMAERMSEPTFTIKEWIDRWKVTERVKTGGTLDNLGWAEQRMKANTSTALFEYKHLDPYNINEGLEIYVEGFHNSPIITPFITICSFNPPGNYYSTPRNTENIFYYSRIDFASPRDSMRYADELKIIRGISPYESSQIILDIKGFDNIEGKVIDIGWSIISLFDRSHNGVFANTGVFMVLYSHKCSFQC